ncbi:bactofilin family protein [Deminuibacter soli]|nr:polymer-forming cytoskeletal protein [Deminuibacter soli]
MLNPKSKTEDTGLQSGKTSMIGTGTVIQGEIVSQSDIRIDGKLIGNVKCSSKVVVGAQGEIEGNIVAQQCDITGKVTGNINVKDILNLRSNALIKGDIVAGKISMEPTVQFNGKCSMQAGTVSQVVEMLAEKDERKAAAE